MIRSMTGFARWHEQDALGEFCWELRSVNHRFLETSFRLPDEFRDLEPQLRERAGGPLSRGKVDCVLRFQRAQDESGGATVDRDALVRLGEQLSAVRESVGDATAPGALDLLRWPGVLVERAIDLEPIRELAVAGFDQALAALAEARESEGRRIEEMLEQRLDRVTELLSEVRSELPGIREALERRLRSRLAELDGSPDPGRLEQELVFHLTRMDVDEELDRLGAHVSEMRDIMAKDEPAGRRLDFLMQEFNREANTLASKSQAAKTTGAAVELKVAIEQMREQIQNVE